MRVQILKHATNRRKYQHMQWMMDWKADLKEKQEQFREEQQIVRKELRLDFGDALADLKARDGNWERWYDKELPDFWRWTPEEVKPIIYQMRVRALHVDMRDEMPNLTNRTGVL